LANEADVLISPQLIHGRTYVFASWQPPVSGGTRLGLTAAFLAVTAVSFALPPDMQVIANFRTIYSVLYVTPLRWDLLPVFQYLLPLANLPLLVAARLPQIWANYRASSTGQLSAVTLLLSFAGALARIFTTIEQVCFGMNVYKLYVASYTSCRQIGWDLALLSTYLVGAALSGILIAQVLKIGIAVTFMPNFAGLLCQIFFYKLFPVQPVATDAGKQQAAPRGAEASRDTGATDAAPGSAPRRRKPLKAD
jgi:hypothetical protein